MYILVIVIYRGRGKWERGRGKWGREGKVGERGGVIKISYLKYVHYGYIQLCIYTIHMKTSYLQYVQYSYPYLQRDKKKGGGRKGGRGRGLQHSKEPQQISQDTNNMHTIVITIKKKKWYGGEALRTARNPTVLITHNTLQL